MLALGHSCARRASYDISGVRSTVLSRESRSSSIITRGAPDRGFDTLFRRSASVRLKAPHWTGYGSEVRRDWKQLIGRKPAHTTAVKTGLGEPPP
jgi:hypothetical protein